MNTLDSLLRDGCLAWFLGGDAKRCLSSLSFVMALSVPSHADEMVVPAAQATQAGNSFIVGPFQAPETLDSVYGPSSFTAPLIINGLSFRLDEGSGGASLDAVIPRMTIRMSTYSGSYSSYQVGPGYNRNKGLDDTTVFDSSVHWVTRDLPGYGPNSFDLKIQFSNPFYYDPFKGGLLMDLVTAGQFSSGIAVDAEGHSDPNVGWFGDKSLGTIVTQFDVALVPEPATSSLLVFATIFLALPRRKKI